MSVMTLFTKPDCPKCEKLKELSKTGYVVLPRTVDATTVDGMAEGAYHEILKADFPVLITGDGRSVSGVVAIMRELRQEASQR